MNPFIVEESQGRYQECVDAAEQWRLEQTARAATTGLAARVWSAMGERLVAWGRWMQARAVPIEASQ
jgi:hypothetical protein